MLAFELDESRLSMVLKRLDSHQREPCLSQVPKSDGSGVRNIQSKADVTCDNGE